jgi:hypothetical protein
MIILPGILTKAQASFFLADDGGIADVQGSKVRWLCYLMEAQY